MRSRVADKENIRLWIRITEDLVRMGIAFALAITMVIIVAAVLDRGRPEEAPIGSFEAMEYNDGWSLNYNGTTQTVTLPTKLDGAKMGTVVQLTNTLPAEIHDGMSVMVRTSMMDIYVYVDGELRASYTSEAIKGMGSSLPSAYVVSELREEDALKTIEIKLKVNANTNINSVVIGYGNNAWFDVIKESLFVVITTLFVLIIGCMLSVATLILKNRVNANAAGYLGLLMMDLSLWVVSESRLRQFIFGRPTLTRYFSYLTVEMIGVLGALYFDEVQHRKHHKCYLIIEGMMLLQILINVILDAVGICPMYSSLIVSHIWTILTAIISIITIIIDVRDKSIQGYTITAVGMIAFVAISMGELIAFYVNKAHLFGEYICIALIVLMAATLAQLVWDEIRKNDHREKDQTAMMMNSIETIAGAIDAKDEYTGGHSERVSIYAERLAREMAADYDFTEEDILRVRYIALMHDIGKIGVADSVLNKSGKLTDEEFSLMKKHTEIGYELMRGMGGFIEGLLEGIRYHHERFDGRGYPDGLSDTDIPLVARILCLADSYDAMTSNRVYRKRLTDEQVREELLRCSGSQFDPALTEIFVRLLDRGELRANIVDGVASDAEGEVLPAAKLEDKLHQDLLNGTPIVHASRVRMICYVMKLMEKKGKYFNVLFFEAADIEELTEVIASHVGSHDINLSYTEKQKVVALYDRSKEETEAFVEAVKTDCVTARVLYL